MAIWLERGLEELCNPRLKEKSGLPHKPTPFVATCPYCKGMMQDTGYTKWLDSFIPARKGDNLFINIAEKDCGQVVFNWNGED